MSEDGIFTAQKKRGIIRRISHFVWFPVNWMIHVLPKDTALYEKAVVARAALMDLKGEIETSIEYKADRLTGSHSSPPDNRRAALQNAADADAYPFNKRRD